MKFLYFLFVLIVLSACGMTRPQHRIKLIKVGHTETVVLVKETPQSSEKTSIENATLITDESALATAEENPLEPVGLLNPQNQKLQSKQKSKDLEPEETEEEANQRILKQAVRAEKDARAAVGFLGVGAISLIAPYFGIFFFTIGLLFYSKAKSSRYITPFGNEKLEMSKDLMIFDSIVLTLWLLLIVLIFLAFLL
jgi:hypothetical protein